MPYLEEEFRIVLELHKKAIIQTALVMFEHEGIYDMVLLRPFKGIQGEGMKKAENIVDIVIEDTETFEALYKYCWELVKNLESMDFVI